MALNKSDGNYGRTDLEFPRPVLIGEPFPRVTTGQLENDREFLKYKERRQPFILVDGAEDWDAMHAWKGKGNNTMRFFAEQWPESVVDFFPRNNLDPRQRSHPLVRLPVALRQFELLPGRGRDV